MLFGFIAVLLASLLLLVVFYVFKKYFLDGKQVIEGLLDGDPEKQARIVNYLARPAAPQPRVLQVLPVPRRRGDNRRAGRPTR